MLTVFPTYAFFWEAELYRKHELQATSVLHARLKCFWRQVPTQNTRTYVITFNLQVSAEKTSIMQVGREASKIQQAMEMDFSFWKASLLVYQCTTCTKDSPLRLSDYHRTHRVPPKKKSQWLFTLVTNLIMSYLQAAGTQGRGLSEPTINLLFHVAYSNFA